MRLIHETVECFSSSIHYHHIKGLQYDNSGVQLRELTCPLPEEEYLGRPESKAETKMGTLEKLETSGTYNIAKAKQQNSQPDDHRSSY